MRAMIALSVVTILTTTALAGGIRYVDDDAPPGGDGLTWETAYRYLQDALAVAAVSGGAVGEIRVARGTYTPDRSERDPGLQTDQTAAFQLLNGVALVGGFLGRSAAPGEDPDERSITHETILSGDLAGNDIYPWNRQENGVHVVVGSGTDATAVLDGFTISGGNASNCGISSHGAGMYNDGGSPTVRNCTFRRNIARDQPTNFGGGMFNDHGSSPQVTGCTFVANVADLGGGICNANGSHPTLVDCVFMNNEAPVHCAGPCSAHGCGSAEGRGGGVANLYDSNPTLMNCEFRMNSSTAGGGMYNWESNPTLVNCRFTGNVAGDGAGLRNHHANPTLINCIFVANRASGDGWFTAGLGGALHNQARSSPLIINSVFVANRAEADPYYGMGGDGGAIFEVSGATEVMNCVLWDNVPNQIGGDRAIVRYSCVQDGYEGIAVVDTPPSFVRDPGPGLDQEWGTADDDQGDLHLSTGSSLIDAGDSSAVPIGLTGDIAGAGRIADDPATPNTGVADALGHVVDIGAYEFGSGDCDGDRIIDAEEIFEGGSPDCNGNGVSDECDDDCNGNGAPDDCDLEAGRSRDCDGNRIPDECDADCNGNGVPDTCELAAGASAD
jgi:hypothetical protein